MAAGNAPQVFPREYETDVAEIRTYDDDAGVFSARFFTHVRTYIRRKCAVRLGWNPELQALAGSLVSRNREPLHGYRGGTVATVYLKSTASATVLRVWVVQVEQKVPQNESKMHSRM